MSTLIKNVNESNRQAWLKKTLAALPEGTCLPDAGGAPGEGLQSKGWQTSRIDLVSDVTAIPATDDIMPTDKLLHGEEQRVFGDAGTSTFKSGMSTSTARTSPGSLPNGLVWKKLDADKLKAEKIKASKRAKVKHSFWYTKQALILVRFAISHSPKHQSTALSGYI
ncbi:hypothetical protein [Marinobacter sp.]|uniref:hypothetical protein n=1 Tax=Marinobacter sp. TaxID=50741 RepID=UPI0019C5F4E2|nr:hypothetical protein [Marinobacter sp.]MBC7192785.1 hypothetical protein [Marinobacter sp.]